MPIPSKATWLSLCGDIPPGVQIYNQIGLDLQIIAGASGFERYRAMGILHERIRAAIKTRGATFYELIPDHVQALATVLTAEMQSMARLVCQNEFATIGTAGAMQPYVFSTGFFECFGLVIFDQHLQRATLAHKAPLTSVEAAVEAMTAEFGDLLPTTRAYVFGGGDSEINATRRNECVEKLRDFVEDVIVITRSELSVDNGYGLFFDRRSGEHGIIRGRMHHYTVPDHPELSIQTQARQRANTTNENLRDGADMLSATRTV